MATECMLDAVLRTVAPNSISQAGVIYGRTPEESAPRSVHLVYICIHWRLDRCGRPFSAQLKLTCVRSDLHTGLISCFLRTQNSPAAAGITFIPSFSINLFQDEQTALRLLENLSISLCIYVFIYLSIRIRLSI
jgi:hypothetical protein